MYIIPGPTLKPTRGPKSRVSRSQRGWSSQNIADVYFSVELKTFTTYCGLLSQR